jgi:hypothetical protein
MRRGVEYARRHGVKPLKKFVGGAAPRGERRAGVVTEVQVVLVAVLCAVIGFVVAVTVVPPEVVRRIQAKEGFY